MPTPSELESAASNLSTAQKRENDRVNHLVTAAEFQGITEFLIVYAPEAGLTSFHVQNLKYSDAMNMAIQALQNLTKLEINRIEKGPTISRANPTPTPTPLPPGFVVTYVTGLQAFVRAMEAAVKSLNISNESAMKILNKK